MWFTMDWSSFRGVALDIREWVKLGGVGGVTGLVGGWQGWPAACGGFAM